MIRLRDLLEESNDEFLTEDLGTIAIALLPFLGMLVGGAAAIQGQKYLANAKQSELKKLMPSRREVQKALPEPYRKAEKLFTVRDPEIIKMANGILRRNKVKAALQQYVEEPTQEQHDRYMLVVLQELEKQDSWTQSLVLKRIGGGDPEQQLKKSKGHDKQMLKNVLTKIGRFKKVDDWD